jgi:hypothetical protein
MQRVLSFWSLSRRLSRALVTSLVVIGVGGVAVSSQNAAGAIGLPIPPLSYPFPRP